MLERRVLFGAVIGLGLLTGGARAQSLEPAGLRMNEPGPENEAMAKRAGFWDLTETVWERPGAPPIVTTNLVAERRMIGTMFQEILRPANEPGSGKVRRIDYLHFNRVEGRWDYVSMDMSAPVGIMSAWSFDRGENARIDITFAPFSVPGPAADVTGQMLRMTQTITYSEPDQDVKDQYFLLADGTGTKWLAHRYEYKRRK
jgi:hypothetical protein